MKPILFNTEMVKAILDGRKTVTRRLVKSKNRLKQIDNYNGGYQGRYTMTNMIDGIQKEFTEMVYPPYKVGDILYVRETWCDRWLPDGFLTGNERYGYKADGIPSYGYWGNDNQCKDNVWIPSIHMPKEVARIFLRVKELRVERLQDMPHDAPKKEGVHFLSCPDGFTWKSIADMYCCYLSPMGAFKALWNSTVSEDWQKFESNPWVWVIEFERCENPELLEGRE